MKPLSTVDPAEAARFEKLANLWWDASGPFWPLHAMNALRAGYIRDLSIRRLGWVGSAEQPLRGLRVLDIGCGGGLLSEALAHWGAQVHGVDMVERNIRIAGRHAQAQGLDIRYECGTVEQLAQRQLMYDLVLNMEVVEHVADLPLFMRGCASLVRPGGIMFVATLNRTLASFLAAIVGAEYMLRWLPRRTHQWRKFPRPDEIERLLKDDGLSVVERTGVAVNPFTRRFRLTSYLGVNYLLVAVKPGA